MYTRSTPNVFQLPAFSPQEQTRASPKQKTNKQKKKVFLVWILGYHCFFDLLFQFVCTTYYCRHSRL